MPRSGMPLLRRSVARGDCRRPRHVGRDREAGLDLLPRLAQPRTRAVRPRSSGGGTAGRLMDPARWERIQEVFAAALMLPVGERQGYVRGAAEDAELRDEVLALLEASAGRGRLDSIADGLGVLAGGDALEAVAPAPRRVGPYAVVHPIAHGGMGSVYLAERADGQLQ